MHRGWADEDETVSSLLRADGLSTVHMIHRLDRATSGVVLIALHKQAAAQLGAQFQSGSIRKRYITLVRGRLREAVRLDHPIPKAPGEARVPAVTSFSPIASADTKPRETSLLWAEPETGRTHQIRRHIKHLNHPIIGDSKYGRGALNRALRARYGLDRMALHAAAISFVQPTSGEPITICAPLPDSLRGPLEAMGYADAIAQLDQELGHGAFAPKSA